MAPRGHRSSRIARMGRRTSSRARALAVAVGVIAAGCAAAPPAPETPRLVWPPPPAPARIEFVQSLATGEDLGSDRSAGSWLLDLVGGSRRVVERLAEPMGVAVSDDGGRVYVADHAQHAVVVFDL